MDNTYTDNLTDNLTDIEITKIITILESSFNDNFLVSIIIGSGNINSDLERHLDKYNIAFGGLCSETGDKKGLYGFPYYYPSNQFNQTINILGNKINLITIDWSVCCDLKFNEIISLVYKINENGSIYIPLRNIKTVFDNYFDDILNKSADIKDSNIKIINKILLDSKINMEIKMNNSDLLYPINKYNKNDPEDRIYNMSYAKFTRII